MSVTVDGHYEGVRFAPSLNRDRPFQILGFAEDWRGSVNKNFVLFMSAEQAQDLYVALGGLLKGVNNA